jgi:hypothetical protein
MASQAPPGARQMLVDLANTYKQLAEQAEQRMHAAKNPARHGRERRAWLRKRSHNDELHTRWLTERGYRHLLLSPD